MSAGAPLHVEVLPPGQRRVLDRMGATVSERGFHLAGGTALALQLGHRRSLDLDWFRPEAIGDPLALADDLRAGGLEIEVRSTARDTLHATAGGVALSFFTYRYPLLRPLVPWRDAGCQLAAAADIAAMKLAAVSQRGARRDYFDLVAIGRSGLGLAEMLECYRAKFSVADVAHVLTALTWFEDADRDPMPILESKESWEDVKATLRAWVKEHAG